MRPTRDLIARSLDRLRAEQETCAHEFQDAGYRMRRGAHAGQSLDFCRKCGAPRYGARS